MTILASRSAGAIALLLLVLDSTAVLAARSFVDDPSLNDVQRYQRCLAMVGEDADGAYEQALAWGDTGGGAAAVHCSALALIQLKHYAQAAFKLDGLAHANNAGGADMRMQLLDQAGNAWLLAGQPGNAEASFSLAIKMGASSADVLSDRARAKALRKNWVGAEADLNQAIAKDEYRSDFLVLRASARHAMGRRAEALADLNKALDLDPNYADALVERGAMKLESGDKAGARADWQLVLATQPKSAAADSARRQIEQLEFSKTKPLPPAKRPATRH